MGHRTNQFSILDNRAAAHALDDAAGGLQKFRVCDTEEKIPAVGAVLGIDFQNFHRIFLNPVSGNGGADAGRAGGDGFITGHRKGFSREWGVGDAEHALRRILQKRADGPGNVRIPLQLPRFAGFFASS